MINMLTLVCIGMCQYVPFVIPGCSAEAKEMLNEK